jgi:hypothetical protein
VPPNRQTRFGQATGTIERALGAKKVPRDKTPGFKRLSEGLTRRAERPVNMRHHGRMVFAAADAQV